jgi:hypothetical protein
VAGQSPLTVSARLASDPVVVKSDGQTRLRTGARSEALSERDPTSSQDTCNSHRIASRLYDAAEAAARKQGITSLFTEASELARRLFERKGFAVVGRQDLVICGVAIHNYRIAKALDLTAPHLTWPGGRIEPAVSSFRSPVLARVVTVNRRCGLSSAQRLERRPDLGREQCSAR